MKKNNLSHLLIAFVLALGVSGAVYFLQSQPIKIVPDQQTETIEILVSKLDINPGERVNPDKFEWKEWPEKSMNDDYYQKGDKDTFAKIDGKVVRYQILRGEPLKKPDLVGGSKESILSALIAPGMKAVSVPLKKVANANVYFTPGDRIDVILPQRQGRSSSVDTILSGVKVIAVDNLFFVPEGEQLNKIAKTITLEVNSEQAEALALSIAKGQIVISQHSAYTPGNAPEKKEKIKKVQQINISRGSFGR